MRKITEYPNGVSRIEPEAFGITGPVRDLPTSVQDAEAKSARYITREEIRNNYCVKKVYRKKKFKGTI
ncbi:MAG: hypothetical protein LC776_20070 [Acidobacteria bacterium]|nr:hypothetical protein [Acidobacteriota bacterium]